MQITTLLQRLQEDDREAMEDLIPLIYQELKKLARSHLRREMGPVPLETTVLVHETYLKLVGGRHPAYEDRGHFFGIVSRLMRQVLVDRARAGMADKRLRSREVPLAEVTERGPRPDRFLLAMHDALNRLDEIDPLKGQLVEMRYFGGMTAEESSMAVSKPVHVVRRELRLAMAWLHKEMAGEDSAAKAYIRSSLSARGR